MAKLRIKESLEELDDNLIYVDYQAEDNTVYIGTNEDTGVIYGCNSLEDLKSVFNKYIDTHYGE